MRMIKGWSARHAVKLKPQQPDGCEDFGKTRNAAIRFLLNFYIAICSVVILVYFVEMRTERKIYMYDTV